MIIEGFQRLLLAMLTLSFSALLAGGVAARAADRVAIAGFAIDSTEVTIAQFREFAQESKLTTEAEKAGGGFEYSAGWERRMGWTVYRPFGKDPGSLNEPAVHVAWEEARAYCQWRGGRLPTADEWRLAAYTETRTSPTNGLVQGIVYGFAVGETPEGLNTNGPDPWPLHAPVASTRKGVNGLFDMGGNVWEWLADRRDSEALTAGGSWWYGAEQTMAEGMQWKPASFYAVYVGIRCAYNIQR